MGASTSSTPVIVVGVDGSPASRSALRWAVRHARATGSRVRAVTVWHYPWSHGLALDVASVHLDEDAAHLLTNVVTEVAGDGADLERVVVQGKTPQRLVEYGASAAMLVLGSHASQHLPVVPHSSVSRYCLQHASCPVVLVPVAAEDADAVSSVDVVDLRPPAETLVS